MAASEVITSCLIFAWLSVFPCAFAISCSDPVCVVHCNYFSHFLIRVVFRAITAVFSAEFLRGSGGLMRLLGFLVQFLIE